MRNEPRGCDRHLVYSCVVLALFLFLFEWKGQWFFSFLIKILNIIHREKYVNYPSLT